MVSVTHLEKIKSNSFESSSNFDNIINCIFNRLYLIHYQNNEMKQLYAKYGEILIIDATYKINTNNYSLYLFIIIDNNGNSQICSLALAAFEREKVFNSLLEHFTKVNAINKTQVILSDFNAVESKVLIYLLQIWWLLVGKRQ